MSRSDPPTNWTFQALWDSQVMDQGDKSYMDLAFPKHHHDTMNIEPHTKRKTCTTTTTCTPSPVHKNPGIQNQPETDVLTQATKYWADFCDDSWCKRVFVAAVVVLSMWVTLPASPLIRWCKQFVVYRPSWRIIRSGGWLYFTRNGWAHHCTFLTLWPLD